MVSDRQRRTPPTAFAVAAEWMISAMRNSRPENWPPHSDGAARQRYCYYDSTIPDAMSAFADSARPVVDAVAVVAAIEHSAAVATTIAN